MTRNPCKFQLNPNSIDELINQCRVRFTWQDQVIGCASLQSHYKVIAGAQLFGINQACYDITQLVVSCLSYLKTKVNLNTLIFR